MARSTTFLALRQHSAKEQEMNASAMGMLIFLMGFAYMIHLMATDWQKGDNE